jgi:hypothetical protein
MRISLLSPLIAAAVAACCVAPGNASTFPVTDPGLYFSPYNTYSDGAGRLLPTNVRAGSHYALWIHPGSYLKTSFTGTAAALLLDAGTISEGGFPRLTWSVDNRPLQSKILESGARSLPLAHGLAPGIHALVVYLSATDANYDRWKTPLEAVKIRGVELDSGGTLALPTGPVSIARSNAIFFGDSITEGAWTLGNSNRIVQGHYVDWVANSDAVYAWPTILASALGFEFGNCGSAAMSWLSPARPAYLPPLPEAWDSYFEGHSRLYGGKLAPGPDYVFVNMGTNDGNRDTSQAAAKWLAAIRSAVGRKTPVVVIIPFGQQNRDSLQRAIGAVRDPFVFKVDLGPRWAQGLDHYGQPSLVAFDGLHPRAVVSGLYAALVAAAVKDVLR